MSTETEFEIFLNELFEPVGSVTLRKMFGGLGIFRHGLMFGLVSDGKVCLKADTETESEFVAEDCEEWVYSGKGKSVKMGYWHVPERLLEDPDEMKEWALKSFDVAVRADMKKPVGKRKLRMG